MGKRKQTALIQMISNYASLSTEDRLHFDSFVRSQQVKPSKSPPASASKGSKRRKLTGTDTAQVLELQQKTGASTDDCYKALSESGNDFDTAETLVRKRGQAAKDK